MTGTWTGHRLHHSEGSRGGARRDTHPDADHDNPLSVMVMVSSSPIAAGGSPNPPTTKSYVARELRRTRPT